MSEHKTYLSRLEDIDRQFRIRQLRSEIEEVAGSAISGNEELPDFIREAFLEYLLLYEKAPRTTYAKMLIQDGVSLPYPNSLRMPKTLSGKLWQVIHALARRQVYLCNTDHLSDRELYSLLWYLHLNEPAIDASRQPAGACALDMLGSGSVEDLQTYLRYYADEEERLEAAQYLAPEQIPCRMPRPFDRDQRLPKRAAS